MTNENRNDNDRSKGSVFWAGRGWLYFNEESGFRAKEIHLEWYFGKHARHTAAEVKTSFVFERELTFNLGIYGLFCFFVTFAFPFFPNWSYKHGDRQIGIRIFDGAAWIDLWVNDAEWHAADPFWKKHIVIRPADIVLGRQMHTRRELSTHDIIVPMPEGEYPATVTFFESEWKRPRWFWPRRLIRADIQMGKPIPFPGKGENDWDMGDDAVFSMTGPYSTIDAAIDAIKASVMRDRQRNGGDNWQPSEAE